MWIIYPLVFLAGFVDAIAGGGGLISLTSYLAIGLPPHLALGTNKFSAFAGTGISATYFAVKGHVRWDSAVYAFLGAVAGSMSGARIALLIDERALAITILCVVPFVALFLIFKKDLGSVEKRLPPTRYVVYSLLVGIGVGFYDGFFGPGTGVFLIMAFTAVMGFDMLTACGNTKMVNFASNIAAVAAFMHNGNIDYGLGIPCMICGIAGNYAGTRLAIENGSRIVRPMMLAIVFMLVGKIAMDLLC